MAGYIGSKSSVTLVDGYTEAEADAEFVNDPNGAITVSGSNVGIGTSSPSAKLEVLNTYASNSTEQVRFRDNTGGSLDFYGYANATKAIQALDSSDNDNPKDLMINPLGGNVGIGTSSPDSKIHLYDGALHVQQTDGSDTWFNYGTNNDNYITTGTSGITVFRSVGTERMRIDSSGAVAIGATNPTRHGQTTKTLIYNGSSTTSDFALHVGRLTTGSENVVCISNGYGKVGSITTSGTSTAYNTSSDYRLKENVVDLTGASARVNQLNPSRFNWIADDTNTTIDGFLAHEVATVVPEAINGTKDAMRDEEYEVTPAVLDDDGNVTTEAVMGTRSVPDYQGIDQSKLVPLLTAALQEALTEIASLKTRVEALEA